MIDRKAWISFITQFLFLFHAVSYNLLPKKKIAMTGILLVIAEMYARERDFEKLNASKAVIVPLIWPSNDGLSQCLKAFSVRIRLIEESPAQVGFLRRAFVEGQFSP
ncbi:hypothetical protein SUGI_1097440 [Cryptomeria japonica]|nr:hypothetical protein SUGI_1097440 [Cryptomeria japonica]